MGDINGTAEQTAVVKVASAPAPSPEALVAMRRK
jgi:hypothetical protein